MATPKRARHYALVSNIDLRMLRRQKAQLVEIIHQAEHLPRGQDLKIRAHQRLALQGILHLLDAVQDNCKVSATRGDEPANTNERITP